MFSHRPAKKFGLLLNFIFISYKLFINQRKFGELVNTVNASLDLLLLETFEPKLWHVKGSMR